MNYHLRNKDITTIENHYEKHFTNLGAKNSGKIIHEIFNDDMHIDIAYYQATDEFPFQILATPLSLAALATAAATAGPIRLSKALGRMYCAFSSSGATRSAWA